MSQLAKKLRQLRGNLSLHEVGKGSGVASADLGRYESGHYYPTKSSLKKLAEYYEIPYEDLRLLYYEDIYADDGEERDVIIKWAFRNRYVADTLIILEYLRQVSPEKQDMVRCQILEILRTALGAS